MESAVVDVVVPVQSSPPPAERSPSPPDQPQLVEAAVVAAEDQTPLSDHPKHGETAVVVAAH